MSTCLMMPRSPSWTTHQSCPGMRRRRVSHPSIHLPRSVYLSAMKIPRPGFRRFSFSAKNSSVARRAVPPRRAAARSTRPGGGVTVESPGFMRQGFKAPNSKLQAPEKLQAPSSKCMCSGLEVWILVLHWMLDVGAWSFTSAPTIGAVSPWRNEQRNMTFRGGIGDDETDRHTIEKEPFAEIIADEKNELEVAGNHFIFGEQG